MTPIEQWLSELGLGQYAGQFVGADVDQDILLDLTDEDLRSLGVTLGHRKKLLRAIADLRAGPGLAPPAPANPAGDELDVLPGEAFAREAPVKNGRAGADAERRQLSIVFCDLVGSTALSTRLDPEDLREVMQAYNRCCAEVVDRFGGSIARFQGDGIVILFGYPQAHEDDAARALRCGLEMIASVGRLQAWPGIALQARAGIATGPVVVGDRILDTQEPATSGHTPNLASRLQACAEPGQVLIEPLTRRLVGGMFVCVDLGTRELKGVANPVPVWRVDAFHEGNRFAASHLGGMTEMIGREHELGLMLHRWQEAQNGEGRVVLLSGDPGIGKSRLVAALLNQLPENVRKPIWQCSPHRTNTALYPAVEQLLEAVQFLPDDTAETKLEKLEGVVGNQTAPMLADLLAIPTGDRYPVLSLSPAERKQRTLDAMLERLRDIAVQGPVCFVIEDVHWIDPTTLELLDHAADLVQRLRVLMILIFRSDYQIPWRTRGHVSSLSLHRLNRTECARVAELAARGTKLPRELLDRIVERTDGVPLYVEELTRSTVESGVLERMEVGVPLPPALTSEAIPSSLQSSLIGRLDRLSSVKDVAQVAAAIGREFPRDLLAAVTGYSGPTLDRALEQLVLADIVHRRSSASVPLYAFRHALIQDAAYGSLLRGKRRELHARIADALESGLPGRPVAGPDLLAHHLTEAGKNERAVGYWLKAAREAAERSANRETVAHTDRGLQLLATLPSSPETERQERALLSTRLLAATNIFGFSSDEVEHIYRRLRDLHWDGDDPRDLYMALYGEYLIRLTRAQIVEAAAVADTMVDVTRPLDDRQPYYHALRNRIYTSFLSGQFSRMADDIAALGGLDWDNSGAPPSDYSGSLPRAVLELYHGIYLWCTGYPDQAKEAVDLGLGVIRDSGRVNVVAFALNTLSTLRLLQLDFGAVRAMSRELIRIGEDLGLPNYLDCGKALDGIGLIQAGEASAGSRVLSEALGDLDRFNCQFLRPHFLCWLAVGRAATDGLAAGLETLDDATERIGRSGEQVFLPVVHLTRGWLYVQAGETANAEAAFRAAMEVANTQGAKALGARAAAELARLNYRNELPGAA